MSKDQQDYQGTTDMHAEDQEGFKINVVGDIILDTLDINIHGFPTATAWRRFLYLVLSNKIEIKRGETRTFMISKQWLMPETGTDRSKSKSKAQHQRLHEAIDEKPKVISETLKEAAPGSPPNSNHTSWSIAENVWRSVAWTPKAPSLHRTFFPIETSCPVSKAANGEVSKVLAKGDFLLVESQFRFEQTSKRRRKHSMDY